MKRIAMMIGLLMVFPNVSGARYYYRGFRYSPYAFNYQHPSGLVPYGVYYSPYVFSPQHPSGLIDGYSGRLYYPYPYYFPPHDCPAPIIVQPPKILDCPEVKMRENPRISKEKMPIEKDGKWVYNYLKSRGLDVEIIDGFSFRNQTVSTIFLIRSQHWLIKYQNPELEKSLAGNPFWVKYQERCDEKEKKYQAAGWRIAKITFGK